MKNKYHCSDCKISRIIDTNLCPECMEIDFNKPHSMAMITNDLSGGILSVDPILKTAVYRSTVSWSKKKRCAKVLYTKKLAAYCSKMNGDKESYIEIKNILGDTLIRYNNNIAVFSDIR